MKRRWRLLLRRTGPEPVPRALDRGLLTERGMKHAIACVEAMKEVLGDEIGLALDCGPGWMVPGRDPLCPRARAAQHHVAGDMITGDYVPYVNADVYREVTPGDHHADPHRRADLSPPELQAAHREPRGADRRSGPVRCRRPRRAEVDRRIRRPPRHPDGPHGVGNGVLGLAALVQVSATLRTVHRLRVSGVAIPWWYDIVEGLPDRSSGTA